MATFPLFPRFPVELQLAIWLHAAILDPEPEVCIVWPLFILYDPVSPEEPALPFTVDTAWPAVAHVCRAARDVVFSSRGIPLRHSPTAGFAVPYRHFIPAIDTLYVGRHQARAVFEKFFARSENAALARKLRHVAVEVSGGLPEQLAALVRNSAVDLRTISIVFTGTRDSSPSIVRSFLPPARRCRLREIDGEALDRIQLRNAWSDVDGGGFAGVELEAQTFVEYHVSHGDNGVKKEQWIEVCEDRLLNVIGSATREDEVEWAPYPRRIAAADRKNPNEYRVLDDDTKWYSIMEYRHDIRRKRAEAVREGRATGVAAWGFIL